MTIEQNLFQTRKNELLRQDSILAIANDWDKLRYTLGELYGDAFYGEELAEAVQQELGYGDEVDAHETSPVGSGAMNGSRQPIAKPSELGDRIAAAQAEAHDLNSAYAVQRTREHEPQRE